MYFLLYGDLPEIHEIKKATLQDFKSNISHINTHIILHAAFGYSIVRATMISSGIDQNPGLKSKSSQSLSICERKLNNTSALAFQKIFVLSN